MTHNQHHAGEVPGQPGCDCCCRWALDYERLRAELTARAEKAEADFKKVRDLLMKVFNGAGLAEVMATVNEDPDWWTKLTEEAELQ